MTRLFRLPGLRPVLAQGLVAVIVVLMLAGCGKKGNPQPPPDEPNTYPRVYPSE